MDKDRFINRKTFLRLLTWSVVAVVVFLWHVLTGKQKEIAEKPIIRRINASKLGAGVYFFDQYIVVKSDNALKVLSNRCTHAGCRINQEINGELVCPCHGSRYESTTGKVLQGPAGMPLHAIPYSTDPLTGEIIVKI